MGKRARSSNVVDEHATMPRKLSLRRKVARFLYNSRPSRATMALTAAFFQQILCWCVKSVYLLPSNAESLKGYAHDFRRSLHLLRQPSSRPCIDTETYPCWLNSSFPSSFLLYPLGPPPRLWIPSSYQRYRRCLFNCRSCCSDVHRGQRGISLRKLYGGTPSDLSRWTWTELLLRDLQPCRQNMVPALQGSGDRRWSQWCSNW
jgi:hypothetical protein